MPRPSLEERFFARVDVEGPVALHRPDLGRCWPWTAQIDSAGYGVLWCEGAPVPAHRVALRLALGEPLPARLQFTPFACGMRRCANPAHWRPKVRADNVLGSRNLAAWNARHEACLMGHRFDEPGNVIEVPGGIACRRCRVEVEAARPSRRSRS